MQYRAAALRLQPVVARLGAVAQQLQQRLEPFPSALVHAVQQVVERCGVHVQQASGRPPVQGAHAWGCA